MKLYFMRHGEASDDAPSDELRPLTEKGKERIQNAAKVLKKMNVSLDYVYASPRVRARQTAEIVAKVLGNEVEIRDEVNFHFDVDRLKRLLMEKSEEAHILFVGHNPSMSELVQAMTGANVNLKTGAVARIDLYLPAIRGAQLKWLISPRIFDSLA
jgi:phosphohistidine phosphatase